MKQDMSEDILIKYILGEATATEAQEIEAWVAVSKANAKKFEEVKIILETSKRLAQVSPLGEAEAWEKFKEKRTTGKGEPAQIRSINYNTSWLRIAAAIVVLIGAGWAGYYLYEQSGMSSRLVSIKTLNEVRTETLPDGSVVHLNKNSGISYTGNFKSRREIKLTGEAFFEVKHNEHVPFTVQVNDITVKDIGTAFNIKSEAQNTEVIVESGIVQVSKSNNSVQLNPNEMVSVKHGDKQLKVEKSTDMLYNYYRSNTFVANGTPLWRLVDILNEAYGANIKIENTALRNVPITSTFKYEDSLTKVLEVIKSTTPEIHIDKTGRGIILK
ncbi:FecR domain-containing protein [Mucilaginibacter sabulilitoris]|uniref:FecR domain-containing protein n=1 Tax=Mucilaginibacter sabulilitoris TaxID=1173583 RepID=A0ABZ0TJ65_9SPHI|nr:FecR domain-containing protein [Mucilaginibacter sabulilitoris]WPU93225.1 FecR domain-containing protein [Mucilaginibacter sabulilitoris]